MVIYGEISGLVVVLALLVWQATILFTPERHWKLNQGASYAPREQRLTVIAEERAFIDAHSQHLIICAVSFSPRAPNKRPKSPLEWIHSKLRGSEFVCTAPLFVDKSNKQSEWPLQCNALKLKYGDGIAFALFLASDPPNMATIKCMQDLLDAGAVIHSTGAILVSPAIPNWGKEEQKSDPIVAHLRQTRHLRIGYATEFPSSPFFYRRRSLPPLGFEPKLAAAIADHLRPILGIKPKITIQWVGLPLEDLWRAPLERTVDMIMSRISFREEREREHMLKFSTPYHTTELLVMAPSAKLKELNDNDQLSLTVGVRSDTTSQTLARISHHI